MTTTDTAVTAHHHGYIHRKEDYLKRLRRIEGQARGLQRMVEEEKYCIDILTQISAITKALQSVGLGSAGGAPQPLRGGRGGRGRPRGRGELKEASDAIARLVGRSSTAPSSAAAQCVGRSWDWKPSRTWLESQNGWSWERPHRQSSTIRRPSRSYSSPVWSTRRNEPLSWSGPLRTALIVVAGVGGAASVMGPRRVGVACVDNIQYRGIVQRE